MAISEKYKGHLALVAANVSWGLMAPVLKDLTNSGAMSSWALSGARIACGAILFWLINFLTPVKKEKIDKADILPLIAASLLVIGLNQVLIIFGLSHTSPIDGAVMCSITPVLTLILGAVLYRQRLKWMSVLGVVIGISGAILFVFTSTPSADFNVANPMLGNTLCLLSQVCGAIYLVCFSRLISKYSMFTLMKWMFLISTVAVLPFSATDILSIQFSTMSLNVILDFAYIVIFATCLAYMLIPYAQRRVNPTVIAMYNYLQPIVAAVVAVAVGMAALPLECVVASVAIFVGVWLVSK